MIDDVMNIVGLEFVKTYTYFKKNYVVNFSDIYITFASWKTCIATTLA